MNKCRSHLVMGMKVIYLYTGGFAYLMQLNATVIPVDLYNLVKNAEK